MFIGEEIKNYMIKNRLTILIILLFALVSTAKGQNIRFSNIDISNSGLPHNSITDLIHDHKGFLWIATHDGLCQYDGYEMTIYQRDIDCDNSLPGNHIKAIFEDSERRIWVGTSAGIAYFDREKNSFKRLHTYDERQILAGNDFQEIEGEIYIATSVGVLRYDTKQEILLPIRFVGEGSPLMRYTYQIKYSDGYIYVAAEKGAFFARLDDEYNNTTIQVSNKTTLTVKKDPHGKIWFGGEAGVITYDPEHEKTENYSKKMGFEEGIVRAIEFTDDGAVWVGGENGLKIVSGQGEVKRILQEERDVTNLSDNAIYVIKKDGHGNIWVGTYFGGINVNFVNKSAFSSYLYGFSDKHLSGKAVRQIVENDKESLWIATEDGGLNLHNRRTREFTRHKSSKAPIALSYYNVHSLLKDSQNTLWVGTFTGGLTKYDINRRVTTYPIISEDKNFKNMIFAIAEDKDGDIWFGTPNGLFVKRAGSPKIEQIANKELLNNFIYSIYIDQRGEIWLGGRTRGLWRYNKEEGSVKRVKNNELSSGFIATIYSDGKDNIWISSMDEGLFKVDPQSGEATKFTTNHGLPSNSIMGIVEDNEGVLWLSSNKGLCSFSESRDKIRKYNVNDGLPTDVFNFGAAYKAADGELFFGTINGMVSFYPDKLTQQDLVPLTVELTKLTIQGEDVMADSKESPIKKIITEADEIVLTNKQASSFSVSYSALNFSHKSTIQYAIRMEGKDSDWQMVGNQNRILFSNLSQGRYELAIKASYDGISWNESGARVINIVVKPPFYLSTWAYALYAVAILVAIYIIYCFMQSRIKLRERINNEHIAKVQAEELNRQKTLFFGNISHDLKTPLSLILGPLQRIISDKEIKKEQRETMSIVLQNAQRMKNILEELVIMSKIEMGQMKLAAGEGDVLKFIDEMCGIFKIFASDNEINFFVNIESSRGQNLWFSPTNIERIVYNLLSNAFKFTPYGGVIRFKAYLEEDENSQMLLKLEVKDNGVGIPKEDQEKIFENYYTTSKPGKHKGAGIGLALVKSLVVLHKGEISVESETNEGALFCVTLNVSREAYDESSINHIAIDNSERSYRDYINENNSYMKQARIEISNQNRESIKILIVEDNRELAEFLKNIFKNDFDVIIAEDGVEGYEMAIKENPDAIISDIMMPKMDGLEMTKKLKTEFSSSHIPIVLLTAKSEEEDKIEGFEYGADAYIEKPFNPQRLELQVKNILNTRCNNIERFKQAPKFESKKLTNNPRDEKFLNKVVELIMDNLDNDQFAVKDITDGVGISRSLLHIKLKSLTDLSANEFVRNIRMKEAVKKLASGMNVSEAAYAVGMANPNYFAKCFKNQFGQTPSEYIKSLK